MKLIKFILKYKKTFFLLAIAILVASCVEEIPLESEGFEEAIVIEGSISNELKQHEIKLSRVYAIDSTGPSALSGADIRVIGNSEFVFQESEPGVYVSRDSFAAQSGVNYQLQISANGEEYESTPMQLSGSSSIGVLQANRIDYGGENGVAITLNNQSTNESANYYRYEYVETFKFTARYYKPIDLVIKDGLPVEVYKTKEEYTCYRSENSNDIILANTNSLSEDNVNNLLLTFIEGEDPKVALRYSILVKQYVISRAAYSYYKILDELSNSDNIFSQSQPGYFNGNVKNVNDSNEKVIGFFDVSSVSDKRIFFNHEDFFDPDDERSYLVSYCPIETPSLPSLIRRLEAGTVKWFATPLPQSTPYTRFNVVPANCVDCTLLGTNEVPEFWEE